MTQWDWADFHNFFIVIRSAHASWRYLKELRTNQFKNDAPPSAITLSSLGSWHAGRFLRSVLLPSWVKQYFSVGDWLYNTYICIYMYTHIYVRILYIHIYMYICLYIHLYVYIQWVPDLKIRFTHDGKKTLRKTRQHVMGLRQTGWNSLG